MPRDKSEAVLTFPLPARQEIPLETIKITPNPTSNTSVKVRSGAERRCSLVFGTTRWRLLASTNKAIRWKADASNDVPTIKYWIRLIETFFYLSF